MGMARVNVWFRDEKCRPYYNKTNVPGWDWVTVTNCMGDVVVDKHPVPVNKANVELELPPGCYIVQGHVCGEEPGVNEFTDKAIVIVGCGQEECVNLIVPRAHTCVVQVMNPVVRALARLNVPDVEIVRTARVLMQAGAVSQDEMVGVLQRRLDILHTLQGAEAVAMEVERTIRFVRGA
jgi:hypothetical protein